MTKTAPMFITICAAVYAVLVLTSGCAMPLAAVMWAIVAVMWAWIAYRERTR